MNDLDSVPSMLNNIPDELKELEKWIPLRAKSRPPKDWQKKQYSFDCAVQNGNGNLAGLVINGTGIIVLDFDKVANAKGELGKGAKERIESFKFLTDGDTYMEKSISGRGLHAFYRVDTENEKVKEITRSCFKISLGDKLEHNDKDDDNRLEVYTGNDTGKYFALTGDVIGSCKTVADGTGLILWLWAEWQEKNSKKDSHREGRAAAPSQVAIPASPEALPLDVAGVVALIRKNGKKWPKFSALFYDGDMSDYGGDDSAADQALMNMLAFWTDCNKELMRQAFSASKLAQREKWQKRPDYQERTINEAVRIYNGKGYNPQRYKREQAKKVLDDWKTKAGYPKDIDEQLVKLEMSDSGNAERLALLFRGECCHIREAGRTPAKWLLWGGKKWDMVPDSELYGFVTNMARITKEAVDGYETDDDVKKYKKAFLTRSENQRGIDACLKRAQGTLDVELKEFDNQPYLLNVQNGVLDLKKGELLPHDKKYKLSKITRAAYRPELMGRPSLWTQALESMIPDKQEREYLQMWAGYALAGEAIEEKILFLYGEGGTGKSTFTETLAYMLGDYAGTVDIELFLSSRNDGGADKATPGLAGLKGVRLAIGAESGIGRKMNDAKLKNLTGQDTVTTRFLYGNPFSFKPCATFMLSSNYLPPVKDATDSGIRRRLVIAPFTHVPDKKDKFLKSKLREEQDNMDAVLAWCVEGFHKWRESDAGLDAVPKRFNDAAKQFYKDSDTLQQFLDEECVTDAQMKELTKEQTKKQKAQQCLTVKVKELLTAYRLFIGESIKRSVFMELMKKKGYIASMLHGNNIFRGLDLKENQGIE